MKKKVLNVVVAMGVAAVFSACGDDPAGPAPGPTSSTSNDPCANVTVLSDAWLFNADKAYLIYPDGRVTDAAGNVVAQFVDGNVVGVDGGQIATGVDVGALQVCQVQPVGSSADAVDPNSSAGVVDPNSSDAMLPGSSAGIVDPNSSDAVNPGSSASVNPNSSAEAESSSSEEPYKPIGNPEEDIKNYPVPTLKNILGNGTSGWNTRYWDACKPHCSQTNMGGKEGTPKNDTQEEYAASHYTARVCNINDIEIPTFTYSKGLERYWIGIQNTPNACQEADPASGGGFTCTDMAPVAVNDTLAYAFVAGSDATTSCGKCFHLQYDGSFKDADGNNAPKATHKALKGKHIIVMASNIGHDVKPGQFDLMVPGGGVGAFDALSTQVNGANINWGAGFGGFLTECQSKHGYDNKLEVYQECVKDMCDAAFGSAGLPNLLRGCHWFADWYMAADNPTYHWEEVECPQYLIDHYMTRINKTKDNRYKWHDDWSTYKEGDPLEEQECLTDEYPNGCKPN